MKRLFLILFLSALSYAQGNVGVSVQFAAVTISQLPPATQGKGQVRYVTDGLTNVDCSTGGGAFLHQCTSDGTNWIAGGGSAAAVPFSGVTAGTNTNALVIGTGGSLTLSGTGTLLGVAWTGTTGTGNLVGSASPTFSGTVTAATISSATAAGLTITTPTNNGNSDVLTISTGNDNSANTGSININSGNASAVNGQAGNIIITGGNASGGTASFGGTVQLNGGSCITSCSVAGGAGAASITAGSIQNGSGTDVSGANVTITAGKGTGAGAVSTISFASPTALGSGTTQQSNTTRLTITGVNLLVPSGEVLNWNSDSGISRLGAASFAFGNGTNADFSATLKATTINAVTALQVNGTAASTITLKKGTGSGNYTSASTTYVVVDSTNMCFTVTIPTGFKLSVVVNAALGTATGAVVASMALTDNASCSTANAGILVETTETTTAAATLQAIGLGWVITGDGAAHNIALQYKTSNGADSATILNSSSTSLPTMIFTMVPSS